MAERPKTSTVRTALNIAETFEELLRTGRSGQPTDPDDLAAALSYVIREGRQLQGYQVEDVVRHLHAVAADEPTPDPHAQRQVERLAGFIMDSALTEPSRDEGAVDTAIRLIGRLARITATDARCAECNRDMGADTAHFCAACWNGRPVPHADYPPSWEQEYEEGPGPEQAEPSPEPEDTGDGEDVRARADQLAARVRGDDEQAAAGP